MSGSDHKSTNDNDEYLEDDGRIISVENEDEFDENYNYDSDAKAVSRPTPNGVSLDLSLAAVSKGINDEKDSEGIQENNILVIFDLPDGSQGESLFKLGQTVEVT